jgi:hypothetical protein
VFVKTVIGSNSDSRFFFVFAAYQQIEIFVNNKHKFSNFED